jgi:hypothetical protein
VHSVPCVASDGDDTAVVAHTRRGLAITQDIWKADHPVLAGLADEIDAAKQKLGVKDMFVRLSSRSPKDAALSRSGAFVHGYV